MNILIIILSWIVSLMLGWCMLSILYWYLGRRVLQDAILFRIYYKRDILRASAIDGEVDPNSYEYEFLEHRLCQTAYASPDITIFNFLRFLMSDEARRPSPDLDRFYEVASEPLKELWADAIDDVKLMMIVNSPIIAFIGIIAVLVKGLSKIWSDQVKSFFEIEVIEVNNESELAPT